ncbi:MAG: CHAT domain-containing protein [Bacteroidota bacterium]|nr:CHAT domain-containing protein [Bacteroidota bacterium]
MKFGNLFKNILFILIFFLTITTNIFSQNYYEDSYDELKDTIFYPLVDHYLGERKNDSVARIADKAFDFYFNKGDTNKAMYFFNICTYYPVGSGMGKLLMPNIKKKILFLRQHIDTMNVHYATLLQIASFTLKYDFKYFLAQPYMENAVKIYEQVNTPALHLASAYYNLGGITMYMQEHYKAYNLYKKALKGFTSKEKVANEYHETIKQHDVASTYMAIALAMKATDQINLELAFNKKALKILNKNFPTSANTIGTTINIANSYFTLGVYDEAVRYADTAEKYIKKYNYIDELNYFYYNLLSTRAKAFMKLKKHTKANNDFKELAFQVTKHHGSNSPMLSGAYMLCGENYLEANKPDSALYYFEKAKKQDPKQSRTNLLIAKTFAKKENYKMAIKHTELNLTTYLKKESLISNNKILVTNDFLDNFNQYDNLFYLAKYYFLLYNQTQEEEYLNHCISYSILNDSLIRKHIDATLIGGNDIDLAEKYHNIASIGINVSYQAFKNKNDEKYLDYFLNFISKATAFKLNAEVNQVASQYRSKQNSTKQVELLQQIRKLENELFALTNSPDKEFEKEISEKLFNYRIEAYELSYELQSNTKNDEEKNVFSEINYHEIQKQLKKNEALIVYFVDDEQIYSVFLGREKIKINSIKSGRKFDLTLENYYKGLKTASNNFNKYASEMYSYLILPFENEIKNIDKITFIPDGKLNQIPFEAIVCSDNENFLIEEFAVSYNYSLFLWLKNRKIHKSTENHSFIGFAPVFTNFNKKIKQTNSLSYNSALRSSYTEIIDGNNLKPLQYSETEVLGIQKLFAKNKMKATVYINENANELNFKQQIKDYSILHIATHGFSSRKNPELSGLFFNKFELNNKIQDITNDGFVYFNEIFTLETNAELVVLSACKTGTGKLTKGEGIMALPRAFIFAGVPNLVVSLWKIHDEKTKDLMLDFYTFILEGSSYSEALRKAKLKGIKNGELPIDWSGIILIGN